MGKCEKHNTINWMGGCPLCWKEEQEAKANQHTKYYNTLKLTAQWFEMHVTNFQDYDIYVEIQAALTYTGEEA